ncbi:MAG: Holliday junction resolvase [Candidatus Binatia bacterium]|nr:Holliday junction resolvase [Candidatus Binatia bacterium]
MELALVILLAVLLVVVLYKYLSLKATLETRAREQYEAWRARELTAIQQHYEELTRQQVAVQVQQWRQESEDRIRKDAVEKSRAVIVGKVTEHLVPFFPEFGHNPKDARFIGTPVDFVVFDGLDAGELKKITFVEVKTGTASLSPRERQIRRVIQQQLVEWEELRLPAPGSPKAEQESA